MFILSFCLVLCLAQRRDGSFEAMLLDRMMQYLVNMSIKKNPLISERVFLFVPRAAGPYWTLAGQTLVCHERNQGHESGSFHRSGQLSLVLGSRTCSLSRKESSVRVQEFLQDINILVVHMLDIVLREKALFCHKLNFCVRKNLSRLVRVEFFLTEFSMG